MPYTTTFTPRTTKRRKPTVPVSEVLNRAIKETSTLEGLFLGMTGDDELSIYQLSDDQVVECVEHTMETIRLLRQHLEYAYSELNKYDDPEETAAEQEEIQETVKQAIEEENQEKINQYRELYTATLNSFPSTALQHGYVRIRPNDQLVYPDRIDNTGDNNE